MTKPDVIVTWPSNCDYPLWRLFIRENRARFGKVIIIFMEANTGFDYRSFVVDAMSSDDVICRTSPATNGMDWRDVAIRFGLGFSDSPWVWFTEQDFYILGGFWDEVEDHIYNGADAVAVYQGDRMHPCSILIKAKELVRLKHDFGAKPPEYDHFGFMQRQIDGSDILVGKSSPQYYHHFNGMSHNFRLISEGQKPVYELDEFIDYLDSCLTSPILVHSEFERVAKEAIKTSK